MIQKLVSMSCVVPTPTVQPIVVPEPVTGSPVQMMNENEEPVNQDPT
jgi:hypothetical protein